MFVFNQQQVSFRQGEVGDGLSEQRHLKLFYTSLRVAQNANINLQGNIYNRGGFRFLCEAPDTDVDDHYNAISFIFRNQINTLIARCLIFHENYATVYKLDHNGILDNVPLCSFQTNKPAALMQKTHVTMIETPGTQNVKALLFTNRSFKPFLIRFTDDAERAVDFAIQDVALINVPKHEFEKRDVTGTTLNSGNIAIQQRQSQYNIVATNACFTDALTTDWVGKMVRISPMGELRILSKIDNKTLACSLTHDLGEATTIRPQDFTLELGWEPIASNDRGWFECCALHDNRLFLANTRDLPNALIASTTEFKLDFDLGTMQDDDGCFTLVPTGLSDEIVTLAAGSTLHIFTRNQVFVLSVGGNAVVPSTFDTTKVSQGSGSDSYTDAPQTQAGGVVYIDSELEKLFYIAYDRNSESYSPSALNLILPPGMIKQSQDTYSLVIVNYGKDTGECIFFINEKFQIVRGLLTLEEDAVPCFTHYTFPQNFLPIKLFVVKRQLYCIFKCPVQGGGTTNIITILDDACFLDFSVRRNGIVGDYVEVPLDYPQLENCYAINHDTGREANGIDVPNDRRLPVPYSRRNAVEIGKTFEFRMITNERSGNQQEVPNLQGYKKHLSRIYVGIKEARRLEVGCSGNKDDDVVQYQTLCNENILRPAKILNPRGSFKGWYDELLILFRQRYPGKIFIKNYTVTVKTSAPYGN